MIRRDSPEWQKVQAWAQAKLQRCRERNDSSLLNEHDTAILRGEIKTLKELLALPDKREESQQMEPEPPYDE